MSRWLDTAQLLRSISEVLALPTHLLLLASAIVALFELGVFAAERWSPSREADAAALTRTARVRIERVDVLARVGPMLGLMGTLIPLGPGLSALGRGDVAALAAAVTVAFDTTVVGLAVGIVGFALGRVRRRHYDGLLDRLDADSARRAPSHPQAEADANANA